MKFEQLKQELKNGVESIYYIYGEDEYAKDSALNQIKNSAISSFPELNYIVFNSDQIEEQSFFEALDSPPFLSEKKVVVLKMYGTKKLSFMDRLTEYLKTPSEFCVFVIVSSALTTLKV